MKGLVGLLVLALCLVGADRAAAVLAARAVEQAVATQPGVGADPEVTLRGFPFLTQAVRGRYDAVDVAVPEVAAEGLTLALLDARLEGARVPLADAVQGRVTEVPVDAVTATALVTYGELSGVRRGLTVSREAGDLVRVTGTVSVFGQDLSATAVSRVRVADGVLTVTAERVELGDGTPVDDVVSGALAGRLDLDVRLPALPFGLAVTGVEVTQEGLVVAAAAGATVLRPR